MDSKELRELIEIVSRSGFSTFELEREGFKLRLVRGGAASAAVVAAAPTALLAATETAASVPAFTPAEPAPPVPPPAAAGLFELKSPIVGTFYRASGPDTPPFVEPGTVVRKGQVLCIVEAMKLMNEIESEIDAEVVEILVANGQPVEYGEILFRLRPSR